VWKRGQDAGFSSVSAEELNGLEAGLVEDVVNVLGEVVADGGGWDGDARCPLVDEVFDVGEAVVAGVGEILGELGRGDVADG